MCHNFGKAKTLRPLVVLANADIKLPAPPLARLFRKLSDRFSFLFFPARRMIYDFRFSYPYPQT